MSGRVFGASLKPAWTKDEMHKFLEATKGDIIVYVINHDKDSDENGEIIEEHTHIYLEYSTPRKVTTVANLLKVESNFIEIVRNKKGYLRYLTHMDDDEKYKYDGYDVLTNHTIEYQLQVMANTLTDKDIADYLADGRGMELLGLVSASKLRTIQSFIHWDTNNQTLQQVRALNNKMDSILESVEKVTQIAVNFTSGLDFSVKELTSGMMAIAGELSKFSKRAFLKR